MRGSLSLVLKGFGSLWGTGESNARPKGALARTSRRLMWRPHGAFAPKALRGQTPTAAGDPPAHRTPARNPTCRRRTSAGGVTPPIHGNDLVPPLIAAGTVRGGTKSAALALDRRARLIAMAPRVALAEKPLSSRIITILCDLGCATLPLAGHSRTRRSRVLTPKTPHPRPAPRPVIAIAIKRPKTRRTLDTRRLLDTRPETCPSGSQQPPLSAAARAMRELAC